MKEYNEESLNAKIHATLPKSIATSSKEISQ
jgi:hypothetical protein